MATLKNLTGASTGFHGKPPGIQKGIIETIRINRRKKPPKKAKTTKGGRPAKPKSKDIFANLTPEEKAVLIAELENSALKN